MKKGLIFVVYACLAYISFALSEVQVSVTETAAKNTFSVLNSAKKKAKLQALSKYIKGAGYNLDDRIAAELASDCEILISDMDEVSSAWSQIGPNEGMLTYEAVVSLDEQGVLEWMKEHGVSSAIDRFSIVILEEPPSLGAMKLANAFGTDVDGTKFFIQNYTLFQRRIRDEITRHIGDMFDVVLLEDDPVFKKHKKQDQNLLGVYFDPDDNQFVVNEKLLDAIRANQPESIVMYYRLDSLAFDYSTRKILVSVELSFKNLMSNATKSIGTREWEEQLDTVAQDMIMGKMAACVSTAAASLLKEAKTKLIGVVKGVANASKRANQPARLIVNAGIFDEKTRKRNMFSLKKGLKSAALTTDAGIISTEVSLTATLSGDVKDLEELYFEKLEPLFAEIGVELSDDQVHFDSNANTIRITPAEEEE